MSDTVSRLREWANTQDAPERAAFELLADQGHWLHHEGFLEHCVCDDFGTLWIDWSAVAEGLEKSSFLWGSSGEMAVLRFAMSLVRDPLGLSSLDAVNRRLAVRALGCALGVQR
jgi:hypothetical protein